MRCQVLVFGSGEQGPDRVERVCVLIENVERMCINLFCVSLVKGRDSEKEKKKFRSLVPPRPLLLMYPHLALCHPAIPPNLARR